MQIYDKYIHILQQHIRDYLKALSAPKELLESMLYSFESGGKRLRPLIVLLGLEDKSYDIHLGLDFACAIEMIHTYSLIHDDLPAMDDDDFRRGVPTNHKVFGEAIAVLAGDAFLTHAFGLIAQSPLNAAQKIAFLQETVSCIGANGMVGGQVLDIQATNRNITVEELENIHHCKTQELIRLCYYAIGCSYHANQAEMERLNQIAYHVGMAFQIQDDLEDFQQSNSSDAIHNKATYPSLLGKEEAHKRYQSHRDEALHLIVGVFGKQKSYALIERVLHV